PLTEILRRWGKYGGVLFPHDVPAQDFSSAVLPSDFSDLERLVERMRTGGLELLFVHSVNPLYELPRWTGFLDALENVPTVVSFSPMVDETSVRCDWLLPDHTYLEGWGYQVVAGGGDRPTVSGLQPVVEPLYDTRSSTDVLLALASRLGGEVAQALPWPDEAAFLEEASAQLFGSSLGAYEAQTAGGFWSRWRQFGGWWSEKPILGEPEATIPTGPLRIEQPQFSGSEEEFPLHLVPYESISLSEGRGANQPWLQELPDPMTTARWNTWVEVNPLTATQLGVRDNDRVRIVSLEGQMEASVVVYPGIRPDAVAIPMGQGHSDYGRFAQGRGANVVGLIAPLEPGRLAWASTRVRLERVPGAKPLARLESLDGQGRESLR
ncbi:MAG: molybdopterin dinucleotide binding domain-containing protein, partial [Candidatus Bipolaricaulota bacterium]